ncbi:MAG: PqqD family protein [Candidatus Omnitrophica bacterium]|nr:PqqD family protein [Candidatus Omnitrophota bacterium]
MPLKGFISLALIKKDKESLAMKIQDKCYRKNPKVVTRLIDDEIILVPLKQDAQNMESIYTISGSGVDAWNMVNGKNSVSDIEKAILKKYEVKPEKARSDLEKFFLQLEKIEMLA